MQQTPAPAAPARVGAPPAGLSARDLAAYLRGEYQAGTPFAAHGRKIAAARIGRALATLPYRERRILELRLLEGQSVEPVAEQLRVSPSTIVRETGHALGQLAATLDAWARRPQT